MPPVSCTDPPNCSVSCRSRRDLSKAPKFAQDQLCARIVAVSALMPRDPAPSEPIGGSLITGFLGSGKTTLLNRLLRHPGMGETAVIVNEFGEIGLDHLLIETALDNAVLLKS